MRAWCRVLSTCGLLVLFVGCAAKAPKHRPKPVAEEAEETPMPTVAPATATPVAEVAPIPTRPVGKQVTPRKGEPIGPLVTHFGAARADGVPVEPTSVAADGTPTYTTANGAGFIIVVEAKPGESELEVARRIFVHVPNDPTARPDLEIETNRDMGDGSPAVCDRRRPNIGGIPGIKPGSFAVTQKISDALNDFACRFETFIESDSSCTMNPNGDYAFVNKATTTQFCMMVAGAYGFQVGDTILSVRLLDTAGNPGPVKRMRIRRKLAPNQQSPKPKAKAER